MPASRIEAVRGFNRFYTQAIGVLDEGLLHSPFSLAEARVLYELAHRERPTAGDIARDLRLDSGYLSRILRSFRQQALIERAPDTADARRHYLALTEAGRSAFAPLDAASRQEIGALLGNLSEPAQVALVEAMRKIQALLAPGVRSDEVVLRRHRPGDMGWIVSRHGALYHEEYGWDQRFEGMVAGIVAAFLETFDDTTEACWIAELDGERVGSIALAEEDAETGRLRLLLVEPAARGHGIGRRLVGKCVACARAIGYRRMVLSTVSILVAARRLYAEAGFHITASEQVSRFGHELVEETWELLL